MKPEQIESIAALLESTWSNSFYKKNHGDLVQAITLCMADTNFEDVKAIIKDYATNYDNAPTVATISRLIHKKETAAAKQSKWKRDLYIEDSEGYGYMIGDDGEYTCIWRPSMLKHGKTKMETLKKHGLTNY